MSWPESDCRLLLAVPRLGPVVIDRLQSAGIRSMADLRAVGAEEAVDRICRQLGSAAWRNRQQALEHLLRSTGE